MSAIAQVHDASAVAVGNRVGGFDWSKIASHLDAHGWALLPTLLTTDECSALAGLYGNDRHFRSHIVMARHGFGRGEYKYFAYPLPDMVVALRTALYPRLGPIANEWNAAMGIDARFPGTHAEFISRCHKADRRDQHHFCWSMARTTLTLCIKTSTESTSSLCR
jgi:uncharacterized protein